MQEGRKREGREGVYACGSEYSKVVAENGEFWIKAVLCYPQEAALLFPTA